ncbi:MAG: hypothetical protein ACJ8MH_05365, partial [Povalibacter sp.]
MSIRSLLVVSCLMLASVSQAASSVTWVTEQSPKLSTPAFHIGGRMVAEKSSAGTAYRYQWPGTYAELAFKGSDVFFRIGEGEPIVHVLVD